MTHGVPGRTNLPDPTQAHHGIGHAIARAATEWTQHREALDQRIVALIDAVTQLQQAGHRDSEQEAELTRHKGELGALRAARSAMGKSEAFTGLGERGLLPNYSLLDDTTTLDVQLWWTTDDTADDSRFQRVEHSIARGSRTALTELAPGATFYVYGSRIKIDGLDLGSDTQPNWATMRLCPACGHGAEQGGDPSGAPCPRCGSAHYADTGSRHAVLPLQRVSAVHHRDDTVLDEDADERVRTHFTVVTGVSVAPQDVVRAWRLPDVAFGAEYVRNATIRSVNVGRPDQAGAGQAVIAGETVNAPGFLTCTACGVVAETAELEKVRHRGWCATRRGDPKQRQDATWQRLFLSHELTTQAVRMLVPLSTLHVTERLASFATALQLGLRLDFGGDPQHLEVTTASLPDSQGRPRQFVVLHDLVPGGTGYLDRLGDHERLQAILVRAREHLEQCPCRLEGRKSCHRCLLGIAPPPWVEQVDRQLALDLLAEVLEVWQPEEVPTVTDIDISLVELSELEQRFRELVKSWFSHHEGEGHSYGVGYGPAGEELDLRLAHDDGVRRWRMVQQTPGPHGSHTVPDLTLTRQDAQDAPIAIYLDGKAYHASPEHNRTGDDAVKRDELRKQGYRVWAITWDDIDAFETELAGKTAEATALLQPAASTAVTTAVPDKRVHTLVRGNPVRALLAYLQDPTAQVWGSVAEQTVLALLQHHDGGAPVASTPASAPAVLLDLARGGSPAPAWGEVAIVPRTGTGRLPMFVVGRSSGDGMDSLGVLAVLDDASSVVGGPAHEAQWRDWLRWGNLLQFLPRPQYGHDAVQRMAAVWTSQSLDEFAQEHLPIAAAPAAGAAQPDVQFTDDWRLVVDFADPQVQELVTGLADRGASAPEVGAEVADGAWQVELAWSDLGIGVVLDEDHERDDWLRAAGWRVLAAADTRAEDVLTLLQENT